MATAWYFCQYKRRFGRPHPARYCAMDDFTPQIEADGGKWAETEVLGNWAIVKVLALPATLDTIAAAPGFRRLNKAALHLSLSDLNAGQKAVLLNWVTDMGYTVAEVRQALGNDLGRLTLGDVLRFCARRRKKWGPPFFDANNAAVFTDEDQACETVDSVDAKV